MQGNVAVKKDMCMLMKRKQKSERRIAGYNFIDRLVFQLIG